MHVIRRLFLIALAPLATLTACATPETDTSGTPSSPQEPRSSVEEPSQVDDEATGHITLDGLAGSEWVLVAWSIDEPADPEPEVTAEFSEGRIAGKSGCNSYFSSITAGEEPGAVTIGPIGATKMMCAREAMEVEYRFMSRLGSVGSLGMRGDQLALTGTHDGAPATMLFARAE